MKNIQGESKVKGPVKICLLSAYKEILSVTNDNFNPGRVLLSL